MHASIPYNDEKPRELNMIELLGWSEVHSPLYIYQIFPTIGSPMAGDGLTY